MENYYILMICTGNQIESRSVGLSSVTRANCFQPAKAERSGSPWSSRSSPSVTDCEINLGLPRVPLSSFSWPCSLSSSTSASRFFSVYDTHLFLLLSSFLSFSAFCTAAHRLSTVLHSDGKDYCTLGFTTSKTLLDRTRELCINERLET